MACTPQVRYHLSEVCSRFCDISNTRKEVSPIKWNRINGVSLHRIVEVTPRPRALSCRL